MAYDFLKVARANATTGTMVAALVLTSCGKPQTETAALKHTLDEPTRGSETTMWAEVSSAEYKDALLELINMASHPFVDSRHALTQRAQFWLTTLDEKLRAEHPEQMAGVPKPVAKVKQDPSVNAFVAPVPVCYDVKVAINGVYEEANADNYLFLDRANGELSAWPDQFYDCKEGTNDVESVASMVEQLNASLPECDLAMERQDGEVVLVPEEGCPLGTDLNGTTSGKGLVVFQIANTITIHTALFAAMTEPQVVGVLAHELGHYYRAHGAAAYPEYDFFYTMAEQNHGEKPTAEPQLRQLGEAAVAAATLLGVSDQYHDIAGQRYRSEMMFGLGTLVSTVGRSSRASDACQTGFRTLNSRSFLSDLGKFPYDEATAENTEAYELFEEVTQACLKDLELTTGDRLTATQVGWDAFRQMVRRPTWPGWVERPAGGAAGMLVSHFTLNKDRMGSTRPVRDNMDQVMTTMTEHFDRQDSGSIDALKTAHERRVGQYTAEQEADDLSAEWLADLGFDPHASVGAMRELGKKRQSGMGGYLLGFEDCEQLFQNDWRTEDGAYFFVPIGDYSEVHHSSCYRMFNLEREIATHNLAPQGTPATPTGQQGWTILQNIAEELSDIDLSDFIRGNKFAPNMADKINRAMNKGCLYSPKL